MARQNVVRLRPQRRHPAQVCLRLHHPLRRQVHHARHPTLTSPPTFCTCPRVATTTGTIDSPVPCAAVGPRACAGSGVGVSEFAQSRGVRERWDEGGGCAVKDEEGWGGVGGGHHLVRVDLQTPAHSSTLAQAQDEAYACARATVQPVEHSTDRAGEGSGEAITCCGWMWRRRPTAAHSRKHTPQQEATHQQQQQQCTSWGVASLGGLSFEIC